jgi:SOS response regulatory protein OraA/RecX
MKTYLKVMELEAKKRLLEDQLNKLKPKAVRELYSKGYSYDQIEGMLRTAKKTIVEILHDKKRVLKRGGRKSEDK